MVVLKALRGKEKLKDWRINRTTCNPSRRIFNTKDELVVEIFSEPLLAGDHNLDEEVVDKVRRIYSLLREAKTITKKIVKAAEVVLNTAVRTR